MTLPCRINIRLGRGFTLLEMMLVLLILSTMTALFLTVKVADMNDQRKQVTIQRMLRLQRQLQWFRDQYCRLPCPTNPTLNITSKDYGYEQTVNGDAGPGPCDSSGNTVAHGAIPAKTIGLNDKEMYDGYGRKFEYMVMQNTTTAGWFASNPITTAGYPGITVNDVNGNQISNQALYVLASYGDVGHGGYLESGQRYTPGASANALADCHCDGSGNDTSLTAPFVDAAATESAASPNASFSVILRYAQRENIASQADLTGGTEICNGGTTGTSSGSSTGSSTGTSGSSGSTSGSSGSSGSSSGGSSGGGCSCDYQTLPDQATCSALCSSIGGTFAGIGGGQCGCSGLSSCPDQCPGFQLISNTCGSTDLCSSSSSGGSSTSSSTSGSTSGGGGGGSCNDFSAGQACTANSDCAPGTICINSVCTACTSQPGCRCSTDSDCAASGAACEGQGTCDDQCSAGSSCTPPETCTDTSQCYAGYLCVSGTCDESPCGVPPYPDGCACDDPGANSGCNGGYCNYTIGDCRGICSSSPTSSTSGGSTGGGGGSSSSGIIGCPDYPSCTSEGGWCTSFAECCEGLQCVGNSCVPCSGPPYADNCGCSTGTDCQSGACNPVTICPGAYYCWTPSR